MSYYENNSGGGDRPGFTEQSGGSFNGGGNYGGQQTSQQTNNYGSQSSGSGYQGGQSGGGGGYSGGNGGGYSGGNRGNYGGGGGGGGGWKGNGGGGGWKGGGNKGGFNKAPLTPDQLAALQLPKRGIILAGNYGAPESLMPAIREIGEMIERAGFTIRASSTDGFDKMVQASFPNAEYHIPWKGFGDCNNPKSQYNSDECMEFAKRYHRDWASTKESHQKIFAKNVRLVLGKNLDSHAHAAIIWSEDGVESPNNIGPRSAHAGHIAALCHACGIPVINISNPNAVQRLRSLIEGNRNHV